MFYATCYWHLWKPFGLLRARVQLSPPVQQTVVLSWQQWNWNVTRDAFRTRILSRLFNLHNTMMSTANKRAESYSSAFVLACSWMAKKANNRNIFCSVTCHRTNDNRSLSFKSGLTVRPEGVCHKNSDNFASADRRDEIVRFFGTAKFELEWELLPRADNSEKMFVTMKTDTREQAGE